jgi:hypothetical protein
MKRILLITAGIMILLSGYTQNRLYEPMEMQEAYEKLTRSPKGIPGENYWQNSAAYQLQVSLDPASRLLRGRGNITYFNNSPDSLRFIIIKLLPNIHKTGGARDYPLAEDQLNRGMVIDSMAINNEGMDLDNRRKFIEYGTNLYVIFGQSHKLAPGSEIDLYVEWNYEAVMHGIRNGAHTDSSFFIGYWYPQVAVYDDVYGWDREDYTGKQETYNDLASYEVEITVPDDYLVWATGDQLNESDIFAEEIMERIATSRASAETVNIITEDTYSNGKIFKDNHSTTWNFSAKDVPDFAWACSNYYNWDANSLKLEEGRNDKVWINAVYPPNTKSFDKVARVAHQSIDYLSHIFPAVPYPFNKHITFNGINHVAVEYPMMANNSDHAGKEMYTELTIHEIAHNYIPFFMLSNERKHAWIDEGWVKLIGEMHGESIGIKREDKEALNTIKVYERFAGSCNDLPLIVPSGNMTTRYNFQHSYAKASNANVFLLDIMKEKGIENPLKEFLLAWQGKHPTPHDFFYFMNGLCGEDLGWFWNAWYFDFNAPDQELKKQDDTQQVKVVNKGGIPLPIRLNVLYDDDHETVIEKSIWSWSGHQDAVLVDIPEYDKVKSIQLGNAAIPDIDRSNNTLEYKNQLSD